MADRGYIFENTELTVALHCETWEFRYRKNGEVVARFDVPRHEMWETQEREYVRVVAEALRTGYEIAMSQRRAKEA